MKDASIWNIRLKRRIIPIKIKKILEKSEASMTIIGVEAGSSEEKIHYLYSNVFPKEIWNNLSPGYVISVLIQECVEKPIFLKPKVRKSEKNAAILTADYSWICHSCHTSGISSYSEGDVENPMEIVKEMLLMHNKASQCKGEGFVVLYKGIKQTEMTKILKYKNIIKSSS